MAAILIAVLAGVSTAALFSLDEMSTRVDLNTTRLLTLERIRHTLYRIASSKRAALITQRLELLEGTEEARRELQRDLMSLGDSRALGAIAGEERYWSALDALLSEQGAIDVEAYERLIMPARSALHEKLSALDAELRNERRTALELERRARWRAGLSVGGVAAIGLMGLAFFAAVQVRRARREEEDLEAWSEFLSVASHEVKSPLQSLLLQIGAARKHAARGEGAKIEQNLDRMERHARRMADMVVGVLDATRIRHRLVDPAAPEVDLKEVVVEVTDMRRELLDEAVCAPRLDLERVVGRWDRALLERIVANLITNAAKYGQGKPVSVRVDTAGDYARLVVSDQGPGIPPDQRERVFGRFSRLEHRRAGHGLGLWIARSAVDALGGRIDVRTSPEGGASFVVELPRSPVSRRRFRRR